MRAFSLSLATVITMASSTFALAAPNSEQMQAIILASADQHFAPRYQALAETSATLASKVAATCNDPGQLDEAKTAYHQAMDAWQGIQHMQVGPVTTLMRNFSMQYWPDTKNQGSRHLGKLLASNDPSQISQDALAHASIAVKGFPAMERLLFSDKELTGFRCDTAAAISQYIATQAKDITLEWPDFRDNGLATAADVNDYYDEQLEAFVDVMKALVEPVEALRDQKLLRPLGASIEKAAPRRAESWRSERSLKNLKLNLQALSELYNGLNAEHTLSSLLVASGHGEIDQQIVQAFAQIDQHLANMPEAMAPLLTSPEGYQNLVAVADEVKVLNYALNDAMDALEIQLGFNSRDGD
ncbi:MAG: imelysin family protein [Pontibacterium sp.]